MADFSKFYDQHEDISVKFSNCPCREISVTSFFCTEDLEFVQERKKADEHKRLSCEGCA